MVHLATIPTDEEVNAPLVAGVKDLSIKPLSENNFTTSVYGSKFAAQELPKHEIPEDEMPKEIAYRMIKDDLSLDGNPMLKYVCRFLSFANSDATEQLFTKVILADLHNPLAWLRSSRLIWYVKASPHSAFHDGRDARHSAV